MKKSSVGVVSLGCPKNLVDTEEMLGALDATGKVEFVDSELASDILVINTCAFIESAREESVNAILDAVARKERGEVGKVIVTGCLAQRYGNDLAMEIPEVDAILGIQSGNRIVDAIFGPQSIKHQTKTALPMASNVPVQLDPIEGKYPLMPVRTVRGGDKWSAYVKVSEGCDHRCTFCAIPSFRGKHRSKPIEEIIDEVKVLVDRGVVEVNLIAQDTTAYGMDLYKELALPRLLERLGKIDGLKWVRLLYCYPTMVNDRLIKTMADTENVVKYMDIPLQHGDDRMLNLMKRGGSVGQYERLFDRMRAVMPDISIRTTFLLGFPGEDDASFQNLMRFVNAMRFDRLGVFTYSPEDGTPGAEMKPVVAKRTANIRRRELLALQQGISTDINKQLIGRELDILVEKVVGNDSIGRSWRDAPEIDGSVTLRHLKVEPGKFVTGTITDVGPYDVFAEKRL
ncbi:MAG: 30S ribosomal protein S12 methylthiotransferase RimO [Armatimonadota bacterium]